MTLQIEKRPWGQWQDIEHCPDYRVKRITIDPGEQISLQKHIYRAETWVVVRGKGIAQIGTSIFEVKQGEFVHVPCGAIHRLRNESKDPLVIIETQTGHEIREDDIVRLEDDYGRAGPY